MDQDKKELTTAAADAAAMTYLQQSGVELADLFTRDILLMHTSVAGVMFTDHFREHAAELKKGDPVSLVLEPENRADPMAILVRDRQGRKLGYIPRVKNEALFHLMDAGKYLYGAVTGGTIGTMTNPKDTPWVEIDIDVFMKD